MSSHKQEPVKRLHAPDILSRKGGDPVVCLTAYDAPTAEMLDEHCDLLLVGDSVGMVVHGLPNTVGVTLDMMILHGQAVMRGARRAMVVIDMPFGSYEGGKELAYQNCARVMKETGAQGVKLESGPTVPQTIEYLVQRGIPVMGHVGLRPQAVLNEGGFKAKGKTEDERIRVMSEAEATADAGAFAVVIDMPFGSYEGGKELAYQNCARVMKETGAQGVKLESGPTVPQTIEYLVQRGIPVMGHVGLRPQAVLNEGGFKAKGKTEDERIRVMSEAEATADAGAFAVVIEGVAEGLAAEITQAIDKPTIGIGASASCDGQILVVNDMLGMFDWSPKFVRRYADLRGEITRAAKSYAEDVRSRRFPAQVETYFSKKPV